MGGPREKDGPRTGAGGPRDGKELCVGAVVPLTGRLGSLGHPLAFVLEHLAPRLTRLTHDGRAYPLRLAVRDSRSEPGRARRAVAELVARDGARIVVTMAGTQVLPAVATACRDIGVPCLSTTFPWQAYVLTQGGDRGRAPGWTYHFAWGLDDIADVFADMWEHAGTARTVGCLWNDGRQGRLLRHPRHGFAPAAHARGHTLVDPGGYAEPGGGFAEHVRRFHEAGTDIVTSAATGADLTLFLRQAHTAGLRPRLVTCSRWLAYPPDTRRAATAPRAVPPAPHSGPPSPSGPSEQVATLVYWTPRHPYRSSLDGSTAAQLADAYRSATGRAWLQPLGLAHALLEVATHALGTAADPTDRRAVAEALGRTKLSTVAGDLDFTTGPAPGIALLPLAGGQWQPTEHGHRLAVVSNNRLPQIPLDGDLFLTD
ncbi:ABC transporter substrate-binding protein [Streptomyces eurocidicus]|uniref:ABC transporter substrate-binding protein n=1 Tax=Streptomyces eurocidicus TaxID=66423 RepID=A0A2N8NT92_STREU|nr:ABC transporter substrate-binding protein [Streptomyces eurocidicus]MBB5123121.1 branched-chain amino acid transport system substrate-binding protein [Streptomyces eurocidicus]MBF6055466.1 ABC transporter substrate-binding protein [Streptomyces eurocidicus]PNE31990.1 ABC transporter substrate-binding protein [Streptomyces eurocidicus]